LGGDARLYPDTLEVAISGACRCRGGEIARRTDGK
jgi:hypothetical protein